MLGAWSFAASPSDCMKRLLYITHRLPYPPDKGERIRAYHEIREFSKVFEVTLACLTFDGEARSVAELRKYCREILTEAKSNAGGKARAAWAVACGRGATEGFYDTRGLARQIRASSARQPFDVVLAYSSAMAPCLAAAEGARRICDLVDVDSAKWGSYAKSERGLGRWLFSREQRAVARTEQAACENADAVVVVTQAEAELLRKIRPAKADDNVHVIGNGVDCDYFDLSAVRPYSDGQATGDVLVFVGTMDYRPNVEAVCWFVQNVWLAIRRQRPGAVFRIVARPGRRRAEAGGGRRRARDGDCGGRAGAPGRGQRGGVSAPNVAWRAEQAAGGDGGRAGGDRLAVRRGGAGRAGPGTSASG